jgi:hypothetical protein
MFATWWEAHRDSPIRVADLAAEVREIVDPSQRGRQYLARAIQGLIGTRQGGFTLERVAELPNKRKVGALYRLQQLSPQHPAESSASSASSAFGEKNNRKSPVFADADHADNGADDADAPDTADLGVDSENAAENVGPDAEGADDADDADDSCDHAARRCDHCGTLGATGRWDWTGRPDGIWLHSRCEEPWFDSERRRQ